MLKFLAELPVEKQQPNLFLAALRHVAGTPRDWQTFHASLERHRDSIRATMLARRTQTNEPGRCATLLPLLAGLKQPLALLEVGASAGLCLLPDRYGYCYGDHRLPSPNPDAPVFPCRANDRTPLPVALPRVVWRMGIDLNPIDPADTSDRSWLETLVWPEQTERFHRLRAALAMAMHERPRVLRGDLLTDLAACMRLAPPDATLVVFHSAVLAYAANQTLRDDFARTMQATGAIWISNEAPGVFPNFRPLRSGPRGAFLLSQNGAPMAWTDGHGAWIEWIATEETTR